MKLRTELREINGNREVRFTGFLRGLVAGVMGYGAGSTLQQLSTIGRVYDLDVFVSVAGHLGPIYCLPVWF